MRASQVKNRQKTHEKARQKLFSGIFFRFSQGCGGVWRGLRDLKGQKGVESVLRCSGVIRGLRVLNGSKFLKWSKGERPKGSEVSKGSEKC